MGNIGVITEQGDLGLGFNPLNNKDRKMVSESTKDQKPEDKKPVDK